MPLHNQNMLSRLVLLGAVLASLASSAQALPLIGDASIGSGTVNFSASGSDLTVTQTTDSSIINWSSFSLGTSESLTFLQPLTSSLTLLRLTSSSPIPVSGTISSFGGLYIVATSGLLIDTLTINAYSLWLTTSDISDADFLAGSYNFDSGSGGGTIDVTGTLTLNGGTTGGSINLSGGGSVGGSGGTSGGGIVVGGGSIDLTGGSGGGTITLNDVPEPASYTLLLAALGILAVTSMRRIA